MKFSDDTIILSLLTCKSDILNQDWTGLWNGVIQKKQTKNWRNDGRCRILCRSNLSTCFIWSYLVALQYFFTQSCYVHAIPLSNAYKQQRDVNITVHSNDITQVTLYKHTESAFTWLINVAVIVKQSISISVSLETPGFRFCCNVFFFLFPQRASIESTSNTCSSHVFKF